MFCVYEITNLITGMIYVGASKNGPNRWLEHQRTSKRSDLDVNDYFHNSIRKHGADSFKFEVYKRFETSGEAFLGEIERTL